MGRIKTQLIKRITQELVRDYPEEFSGNFDTNKGKVEARLNQKCKRLRNKIAGYVTRLKRKNE